MMKSFLTFFKNPCNFYTFLWCIYYLQGTLYPFGSPVAKIVLVVSLAMSAYHLYNCISRKGLPPYFKGVGALLIVLFIYGFYRLVLESRYYGGDNFLYIKNVCITLLPVYSYYYYTITGKLNENTLRIYAFLFLSIAFSSFMFEQQTRLERAINRTEFTINKGYFFVGLLPFTFLFYKRKLLQYAFLAGILFMIVLSMKRGAILCGGCVLIYFLFKSLKNSSGFIRVVVILLTAVLVVFFMQYMEYMLGSSEFFAERYEKTLEGDASDRENMYPVYFQYFIHQNSIFSFFFGNGINGMDFIFGGGAHNDWLEIAIDFGLIGIILYVYYFRHFVKSFSPLKEESVAKMIIVSVFIIDGLKTFFSFSIDDRSIFATCALGYALAAGWTFENVFVQNNLPRINN